LKRFYADHLLEHTRTGARPGTAIDHGNGDCHCSVGNTSEGGGRCHVDLSEPRAEASGCTDGATRSPPRHSAARSAWTPRGEAARLGDHRVRGVGSGAARAVEKHRRRAGSSAEATRNVPAYDYGRGDGMICGRLPCSIGMPASSTPSIVMIDVPAPWTAGGGGGGRPILVSTSARLRPSGLRAPRSAITLRALRERGPPS